MKQHPNLVLLAGLVLSLLSAPLLGMDGLMVIAELPGVGLIYPCLPFIFLQLLLCSCFRRRFRAVRLLPLILVAPFHLLGWYLLITASGAYAIPGLLVLIFTIIPVSGLALGWLAWAVLRRQDLI